MSKKALTKLWVVLSVFVLGYALNVWLKLQGAEPIFEPALLHSSRAGIIVIALVILPVIHALANLVACRYSSLYGTNWASRLPLFFLESVDFGKRDAQWYQGTIGVLFVILPFFALLHFFRELVDADNSIRCGVVVDQAKQLIQGSMWAWPSGTGWNDPCRLISAVDVEAASVAGINSMEGSVTFFPLIEPIAILALIGADIFLALVLLWNLSGCGRSRRGAVNHG